jgi:SPP1 family predicted phage head-tail adaptor
VPRTSVIDPRMPKRLLQRFLDRLITFQQRVDVPDGRGGNTTTWTNVVGATNLPACIQAPKPGADVILGEAVQSRVTHQVFFQYTSLVNDKMRATDGARIFAILALRDLGDQQMLMRIDCQERG